MISTRPFLKIPTHEYVVPRSIPITVPTSNRKEENRYYRVYKRNLLGLSCSAAKENVNVVVAIISRVVNIFMFIERMMC